MFGVRGFHAVPLAQKGQNSCIQVNFSLSKRHKCSSCAFLGCVDHRGPCFTWFSESKRSTLNGKSSFCMNIHSTCILPLLPYPVSLTMLLKDEVTAASFCIPGTTSYFHGAVRTMEMVSPLPPARSKQWMSSSNMFVDVARGRGE